MKDDPELSNDPSRLNQMIDFKRRILDRGQISNFLTHELGHSTALKLSSADESKLKDPSLYAFPNVKRRIFEDRKNLPDLNQKWKGYAGTPREIKARIDSARRTAKERGFYDAGTQDFTKDHLDQLKEQIPENQDVRDLFYLKTDDEIIYLMNEIAKSQDSPQNDKINYMSNFT